MPRNVLTEARDVAEAAPVEGRNGRFRIELITPGWGASAYYPATVLEAAGAARVFPAGTQMHLDHRRGDGSGLDERGNRSVRDLAAVLAEDAVWDPAAGDGTGALVAEATVFGNYRDVLAEMADSIGVSVIALADVETGQAEGRRGTIVTEMVEGRAVDFVTRPGRGGRIVEVLESADARDLAELSESRNVGQWIESRIHRDFTITADDMAGDGRLTREERISLSAAIGDALAAFVARLEADQPQLYTRDLWEDPQDTIAAAIEAAENVTATRPDSTTTTKESKEDTMPEIAESELAALRADAGRVQTLESELSTERTARETAESERDELREADAERSRRDTVHRIVAEAADAASVSLDEDQAAGIATRAVFNDDRTVNESETRRVADERIAVIKEARGAGTVRGFGKRTSGDEAEVSESDVQAEIRRRAGITEQKGA